MKAIDDERPRPRAPRLLAVAMLAFILSASSNTAEMSMIAFGEQHKSCQMWTNWQELCSRTGQQGVSRCTSEVNHRIKPSEPFCVTTGQAPAERMTKKAVNSMMRYCDKRATSGGDRCLHWDDDRPFSGRQLASRRHPWCDSWSDEKTWKPICSEKGQFGLSRCDTKSLASFKASGTLYCSHRSVDTDRQEWCDIPQGWGQGPDFPKNDVSSFVEVLTKSSTPAVGLYCSRRM